MFSNNPYAPPKDTEPRGRLGFRHIPAVILTLFGGLLVAGSVLRITLDLTLLLFRGMMYSSGFEFVGGLLVAVAGAVWVVAGRRWLHRKWWPAILFTVAGYVIAVGGGFMAF